MLLGKNQKRILAATDIGMLLYWLLIFFDYAGWLSIDPEYMYSNHHDPLIVAWNLSFLPIDIAFAVLGLAGLFLPVSDMSRRALNLISLTLMFCAGVMALSFWALIGDYKLFWWAVNLWLAVLPLLIFFKQREPY